MSWAWMGPIPIPWLYESVAGSLAAPLFCGRDLGLVPRRGKGGVPGLGGSNSMTTAPVTLTTVVFPTWTFQSEVAARGVWPWSQRVGSRRSSNHL